MQRRCLWRAPCIILVASLLPSLDAVGLKATASERQLRRSGRRTGSSAGRGIFQAYDFVFGYSKCSCDCCIVETRRPAEVDGNIVSKCAIAPESDDRILAKCRGVDKCSVVNDPVLSRVNMIALDRFCFYRCQPAGNMSPEQKIAAGNAVDASYQGGHLIDTMCVDMPADLLDQAQDSDGNGRDPEVTPAVP